MATLEADTTKWEEARLFSLEGIKGNVKEQENRASSALLAVIRAVPEYAKEILADFGAPTPRLGKYRTYTQANFKLDDRIVRPDGVIQIDKPGGETWTCLLEFKTGANHLEPKQLEDYLDVLRAYNYQCILTISNEITAQPTVHPTTTIDKRKLKNANLRHLSWAEILQKALVRQNFTGISDVDQKWILEELIRYLRDERSGAHGFTAMGPNWVSLLKKVTDNTLRSNDKEATDIAERFDVLLRFLAIKLTSQIGLPVTVHYTKQELDTPGLRSTEKIEALCKFGLLTGSLRIPNAISPLSIVADLRRERIDCTFEAAAPAVVKETAKVNWLTRQLKDATITLQIEAYAKRAKDGITTSLTEATTNPKTLFEEGREITRFDINASFKMGKRGNNLKDASFIDSMLTAAQTSYDEIGTHLKAWVKPPTPRYIKADPSPLDDITIRDNPRTPTAAPVPGDALTEPQSPSSPDVTPVSITDPPPTKSLSHVLIIHNRARLAPLP